MLSSRPFTARNTENSNWLWFYYERQFDAAQKNQILSFHILITLPATFGEIKRIYLNESVTLLDRDLAFVLSVYALIAFLFEGIECFHDGCHRPTGQYYYIIDWDAVFLTDFASLIRMKMCYFGCRCGFGILLKDPDLLIVMKCNLRKKNTPTIMNQLCRGDRQ